MLKASDVRSLFGTVSQKRPIFRHAERTWNQRVRGIDVAVLKFRPSLCQNCNNARTQPFDRAWEQFSAHVRRKQNLRSGSFIQLDEVFKMGSEPAASGVHFYFLKMLGCYAVEYNVPLPLNGFAVSLLTRVPHPSVFLTFCAVKPHPEGPIAQVGAVRAVHLAGRLRGALWHYVVGNLGVIVTYTESGRPKSRHLWHPEDTASKILLQ